MRIVHEVYRHMNIRVSVGYVTNDVYIDLQNDTESIVIAGDRRYIEQMLEKTLASVRLLPLSEEKK